MINDSEVKRLALILALQADIDGMKALNQERLMNGDSPGYTERDFSYMAEQLRELAHKHPYQI